MLVILRVNNKVTLAGGSIPVIANGYTSLVRCLRPYHAIMF